MRHRLAEQLRMAEADADALLERVQPALGIGVEGRRGLAVRGEVCLL
jgi:hypothetical protein